MNKDSHESKNYTREEGILKMIQINVIFHLGEKITRSNSKENQVQCSTIQLHFAPVSGFSRHLRR